MSASAPPPEASTGTPAGRGAPPAPDRTAWVGRAKPPAPPPPPADPYWPPVEQGYTEPYVVYVPPPRRRSGVRVLLVLGLIFAAFVAGGIIVAVLNAASSNPPVTAPSGGSDPAEPDAPPAPPGVGDTVSDGSFEFVVNSVDCGRTSLGGIVKLEAKGQYCIVDLTVTNSGDESPAFSELWQRAYDANGNEYGTDALAGAVVNQSLGSLWTSIPAGESMTGKIVYDIPADATLAKLELHHNPLSAGAVVSIAGSD